MGLGLESATFLEHVRELGVNFDRTAMIGRQQMYVDGHASGYAEDYLRSLGATAVTSFDASSYEGAEHIHDFNLPIPPEFHDRFSVVLDGGTLEHIFDFPQAIKNCMRMVEEGGHLLILTPTNNYSGHGFYQFSPDLFFRVLSPANGFSVELMLVCRAGTTEWSEVKDERFTAANGSGAETLLLVMAKKEQNVPLFAIGIQQSGYVKLWDGWRNG